MRTRATILIAVSLAATASPVQTLDPFKWLKSGSKSEAGDKDVAAGLKEP